MFRMILVFGSLIIFSCRYFVVRHMKNQEGEKQYTPSYQYKNRLRVKQGAELTLTYSLRCLVLGKHQQPSLKHNLSDP